MSFFLYIFSKLLYNLYNRPFVNGSGNQKTFLFVESKSLYSELMLRVLISGSLVIISDGDTKSFKEHLNMSKKIHLTGIIDVIVYFISVGVFLISKTDIALTIWELMTVISGPIVLFVLLELSNRISCPNLNRRAMQVFMGCTCALTGAAHIVNIAVTRRLIREGVAVPLYFQIGQWPSVEMAVDYLAWGFFMGLAFICLGIPVSSTDKTTRSLKMISLINGILCLIGFIGALFINENIWYLAPMGYGFGLLILCIIRLRKD